VKKIRSVLVSPEEPRLAPPAWAGAGNRLSGFSRTQLVGKIRQQRDVVSFSATLTEFAAPTMICLSPRFQPPSSRRTVTTVRGRLQTIPIDSSNSADALHNVEHRRRPPDHARRHVRRRQAGSCAVADRRAVQPSGAGVPVYVDVAELVSERQVSVEGRARSP